MEKTVSAKVVTARIIRICSVPPLMVTLLILLLSLKRDDVFLTFTDTAAAILFLTVIPALAYPLSALIPSVRSKGREGQRSLAFVLSAAGYVLGALYGLFMTQSRFLRIIFFTYLLSVVFLLICNKLLHVRASGHACSIAGVLLISTIFFGGVGAVINLAAYLLILWASVTSGRHTLREYLAGTLCCGLALLVAWFC